MCGGGAPEDKSDEVARIEAQAAREAREEERRMAEEARIRQEQKEAADLSAFQQRLESAFSGGLSQAENYFQSRGLDPSQYRGQITSAAQQRRSTVPELSGEVGSFFSGLGESVYDDLTGAARGNALRGINQIAPEGFARGRIVDTADDSFIESILAEERGEAEGYAQRLRDRGVITDSGLAAAMKNIGEQANRGQFTLSDLGMGLLEEGRSGAVDIANRGRSRASNLELGEQFDPFAAVGGELNDYFTNFMSTLGDRLRSRAPSDLFDVSGLPVLAGAAQGAGNTIFDPNIIAGLTPRDDDEDDDDDKNNTGVF